MQFDQLYSGSSGNLYLVTANSGKRLLIECGVTWSKLQKALNYNVNGIVVCLLSHEHQDHSKAIKEVMRAGIDVFASAGTFEALGITEGTPYYRRAKIVKDKSIAQYGGYKISAFATNHDCEEPLGFVVRADNEFLLFATDTSHIRQRFKVAFDIVAIECSYDINILQARVNAGDINESVAKRLLTSHTEKQTAITYLSNHCDLSRCREIHLLHCSGDNLDKVQTKKDFEERFFIETKVKDDSKQHQRI